MNTTGFVPMETTYIAAITEASIYDGLIPDFHTLFTTDQLILLTIVTYSRIVISIISLLANLMVIWLQFKYQLHRKTNYIFGLFVNVSDLGHSIFAIVECVVLIIYSVWPIKMYALTTTLTFHSNLCMCGVAVDRYLALSAIPFSYKRVVTVKKYLLFIIVAYVASGCVSSLLYTFVLTEVEQFVLFSPFLVLSFLFPVLVLYVSLSISLSKSYKTLELPTKEKMKRVKQTRTIMFTFYSMLFTNFITALPTCIFSMYLISSPSERLVEFKNLMFANSCYVITLLNHTLNPLIYFKLVLMKLINCPFCLTNRTDKDMLSSISKEVESTAKETDKRFQLKTSVPKMTFNE